MTKSTKHLTIKNEIILIGIGLGVTYWFLEAVMHAFVLHEGHFIEQIFPLDPNELWMRSLIVCLFVAFGIYGQFIVGKLMRAEDRLQASNQQLQASQQQLRAANQQLRASEQQLKAANQQLKADEEQLRTVNQQLRASEQQLKAANQQLRADEQQLKAANQQLKADEEQLRAANQQLKANEQQLKAANQQLKADEQQLKAANQQLRATEETLRESEEKYRTLTESSLTGVFIHQDERYVFVNDRFAEIHGYRAKELLGNEFWTLVHPDERQKVSQIRSKRLKGREVAQRYEIRRLKKDGEAIWCEMMASRIEYMGKPAVMGNIIDITERKQAEQKFLEYQGQLKSMASELSLTEEHERRQIATELHATIGQSLVISKLQLDTLRASAPSGELGKTLAEVCKSLNETIQNTRSLTFDLSSPILHELGFEAAVAEFLTERIQKKHGITAEFEDDEEPKPLTDDICALLFRDVRELLVNVVKHAQAEKIKVSIRKVGSQMHVGVEDDGVGFDPAEVASMAVRRGGFGLFSIRERLEQLGGHLEIESEPGQGTKVILMAPLKEQKLKDKGQV